MMIPGCNRSRSHSSFTWFLSVAVLSWACSSPTEEDGGDGDGDGSTGGSVNGQTGGVAGDGDLTTGGSASGGAGTGGVATGGAASGGSATGGAGTGGMSTGGSATGGSGTGGDAAGGSGTGGSPTAGFTCPAGSDSLTLDDLGSKTATPIPVPAPPSDQWFLEGSVWIDGTLYASQIRTYPGEYPPSNIIEYTPGGSVTTFISEAGTNGLAVNAQGQLVGASHAVGGIVTFDPSNSATAPTTIVDMYGGNRFNAPNDLTIRSDGTIYFTDPTWQCGGSCTQASTDAYRLPPGGTPEAIGVTQAQPNGISLSPDEGTLYVGGGSITAHTVNADGSVGTGTNFGNGGSDGMVIDCAGNVYATQNESQVAVFNSAGDSLGTISAAGARNVAFGGPNSTTLYIVGIGSGNPDGGVLYSVELNIPGYPY